MAIHRVFRPPWTQSRPFQRLANSGWLTAGWLARIGQLGPFDAVVVGSDPAFSPLLGRGLRRLLPDAALVHWCFDLYPEAIAAEGGNAAVRMLVPAARQLMKWGYGAYDALVDIGPADAGAPGRLRHQRVTTHAGPLGAGRAARACRRRSRAYAPTSTRAPSWRCSTRGRWGALTITGPSSSWRAPAGRARATTSRSVSRRAETGRTSCARRSRPTTPTSRWSPSPTSRRCRPGWAPPTFISSACNPSGPASWCRRSSSVPWPSGGPVLYAGPGESEIARWVATYDVGLTVDGGTLAAVVDRLHALVRQPDALARWQTNAFAVYQREFSKKVVNDRWDETAARADRPARLTRLDVGATIPEDGAALGRWPRSIRPSFPWRCSRRHPRRASRRRTPPRRAGS